MLNDVDWEEKIVSLLIPQVEAKKPVVQDNDRPLSKKEQRKLRQKATSEANSDVPEEEEKVKQKSEAPKVLIQPEQPVILKLPLPANEDIEEALQKYLGEKLIDENVVATVIRVMGEQAIFSVRKKKR